MATCEKFSQEYSRWNTHRVLIDYLLKVYFLLSVSHQQNAVSETKGQTERAVNENETTKNASQTPPIDAQRATARCVPKLQITGRSRRAASPCDVVAASPPPPPAG